MGAGGVMNTAQIVGGRVGDAWDVDHFVRAIGAVGHIQSDLPCDDSEVFRVRLHFGDYRQGRDVVSANAKLDSAVYPERLPGAQGH